MTSQRRGRRGRSAKLGPSPRGADHEEMDMLGGDAPEDSNGWVTLLLLLQALLISLDLFLRVQGL
ncbi:hypothetical protein GCM10009733_026220 [Nonomuraea maheshkhaliensis]|uniref:Uncharacterized protein n=1 Tax=Nonomuraea maheshkhaliensis TaxID=419590 RepID=A0ABN2F3J8_9ACTN